jgi:shikimate kinase
VPTVVLVGFSCSGKSSLIDEVREWDDDVELLDSDKEVAKGYVAKGYDNEGHIFQMFLDLDRLDALNVIKRREREFLDQLPTTTTKPRLIAAGPALPSRDPEWTNFKERVGPSFIYLEITPQQALERLRKRRERHQATLPDDVVNHERFGSWDQHVTTELAPDGRWHEVDDAMALSNIQDAMRLLVEMYESLTPDPDHRFNQARLSGEDRAELVGLLKRLLGIG